MELSTALQAAAETLELYPALLWEREPNWDEGLNATAINRLAAEAGHGEIIADYTRPHPEWHSGIVKPNRILRFTDVRGERHEVVIWTAGTIDELSLRRRPLQAKKIAAILREWAKEKPKAKPVVTLERYRNGTPLQQVAVLFHEAEPDGIENRTRRDAIVEAWNNSHPRAERVKRPSIGGTLGKLRAALNPNRNPNRKRSEK